MSHVSPRRRMVLSALALASLMIAGTRSLLTAGPLTYAVGKVGTIVVTPTGDFYFHLENKPQLCTSTPSGDGKDWVFVSSAYVSSDGKKNLLSVITAAKLAGRSIQVRGESNATSNEWGCHLNAIDFY